MGKTAAIKNGGAFTLSIDLELAWGGCDKLVQSSTRQALQRERDIVRRILDLFSKYDTRATWAIVGHLLLTECEWAGNRVHPEISRPIVKNGNRDWLFQHPKNQDDPLWYGRDMVAWIRDTSPKQEVGSHSFCHMPYDEATTNHDSVKTDIERAKELHAAFNLPFEAFVFPRNRVGHRKLLAKAGVRVYRGVLHPWYDSIPSTSIRRLLNLLSYLIPVPPHTVKATVDETGMVNVPDSMLLLGRNGLRSLVPSKSLIRKGIVGLNRAVARGEVFHLWFHPSNFAYKTDEQFHIFETILRHAELLRKKKQLENLTMGDIRRRAAGSGKSTAASSHVQDHTLDEPRSHTNKVTMHGARVHCGDRHARVQESRLLGFGNK